MSKHSAPSSQSTPRIILSNREQTALTIAWTTSLVSSALAILVWGKSSGWQLSFSPYQLFPLLGLLAFSLMWSHYVSGFISNRMAVRPETLTHYFESTGMVVLALLLLHPGILILQRFRDGYGFPPDSYKSYVAPGLGWVTTLGSIALLIFIAYEFRRKFSDRSWWKYVPMAGDAAMLAIVYHGLRLGNNLQSGLYRGVWIFYGTVLVIILGFSYYGKLQKARAA